MKTRKLSKAEEFYVSQHKNDTVEQLAEALGTSRATVKKYLDTIVQEITSEPEIESEPEPERSPLENTRFQKSGNTVSMTKSQAFRDNTVKQNSEGNTVSKVVTSKLKAIHDNADLYVPRPDLPVS